LKGGGPIINKGDHSGVKFVFNRKHASTLCHERSFAKRTAWRVQKFHRGCLTRFSVIPCNAAGCRLYVASRAEEKEYNL
jgi:hypothetical protein